MFNLELGCAWGSVLGPVIFNLYMKGLPDVIDSDLTVSYADDTYVVITEVNWSNCKNRLQNCIAKHMDFLKQRGVICNKEKTELITFLENPLFQITLD